ncbi:MAG: ATP-dependent zinc metalloprotease FtsH [Algisphaera sp.]
MPDKDKPSKDNDAARDQDKQKSSLESTKTGGSEGKDSKDPKGKPPAMSRGSFAWIMLAVLAVTMLLLVNAANNGAKEVTWGQFYKHATDGDFKTDEAVIIKSDRLVGELKEEISGDAGPTRVYTPVSELNKPYRSFLLDQVHQDVKEQPGTSVLLQILIAWGPLILLGFLIYFFVFRSMRGGGGPGGMLGNFGRSKHKMLNKEHSTVTLDDVAGITEAKDEVNEVIEFLKDPSKFQRLGGRVPRGVLLIGRPGCGKTLLAKAVAGEADVPFFSISGSDFVEMFVGVGASRVRDLFKQAKESAPCIIFLDEIDAVGRRRGNGFSSGGHDEREQTLNAILVEMDGFDSSDQVIVIASTNRADVLDPALIRPGRFDRQVHVSLPDIQGRLEILKVHARKIKLNPKADLEKVARGTPMFSGAELAAIINEAAIGATMLGKDFVETEDLEEARDKVRYGRSRKSHRIEEDERRVIAYHEAGHAILMYFETHSDPLHKVTIIPRGQALGTAFMLPEKDRHLMSRNQMLAQLRVTYGGRISEDMFCGDITSGAAMDIRQATSIARAMVTEYGMSEALGFQVFGPDESKQSFEQPDKMFSEATAKLIDSEVKKIIDETYAQAATMLEEKRDELDRLAKGLLKYETLTRDECTKVMAGEILKKATVSDLLEAEKKKRLEEALASEAASEDDAEPASAKEGSIKEKNASNESGESPLDEGTSA